MKLGDSELDALVQRLGRALLVRGWHVATAESCTGGWIAKALTDLPGSSQWFEGGLVTYSNAAKTALLDVTPAVLAEHGAVSEATVRLMAEGACRRFGTELAVAVSGIAGPGGGTLEKPVGAVWFAWTTPGGTTAARRLFTGGREAVRRQSVALAIERLVDLIYE